MAIASSTTPAPEVDVLVVGAGPTGLTLACQLARFGVRFRIIDKPDRARESRALGVQARSLEVLQALGLGERRVELVRFREESTGVVCVLRHVDGREEAVQASYVAGCDGAHSTVRKEADIAFEGGAYPQTFALGDVEADGALVPPGRVEHPRRHVLVDANGEAFTRLGIERHVIYLVRPDGHIAFRSGGTDLRGPAAYLAQWFNAGRTASIPK